MRTLDHSGVYISIYEPVGLKIKYKKKELILSPEAEQMVIAWVHKLETSYVNDPLFVSNFTRSLVEEINKKTELIAYTTLNITDFNFSSIQDHIQGMKTRKEGMSKEERKLDLLRRKEVRERLKDKYGYALIDGFKVPLMNWTTEPSAIFVAKGLNKLRGCWKRSVTKKDITLNMSKIPEDSEDWGLIVWRPKEFWIASWKSPLDGKMKYVWLAQSAQLRQEKERKKFELAFRLQDEMDRLEIMIDRELDGGTLERRKIATVVYLMKNLALRVGDEKIAGEYGTVGCTTLKKENIRLEGYTVHLSFKGKDYVQWDKSMVVSGLIKENLEEFLSKTKDDFIFKENLNKDLLHKCTCGDKSLCPSKILRKRKSIPAYICGKGLSEIQNSMKSILPVQENGHRKTKIKSSFIDKSTTRPIEPKSWKKLEISLPKKEKESHLDNLEEDGKPSKFEEVNVKIVEKQISDFLIFIIQNQNSKSIATIGQPDLKSLNKSCVSNVIAWFSGLNLKTDLVSTSGFIFEGIRGAEVSSFLRELIPGVSAKVFRTCIAGSTWEENADLNLKMINNDTSKEVKKYLFKMTNLEVAKKLNHKRALPKGYDERKERIRFKLEAESNKLKEMYATETDSKKIEKQKEKTEKLAVSWDLLTNTAEWNLGTSLASYISPEKVMHFVEESELEPEDVYSKALLSKFSWAIKRKE